MYEGGGFAGDMMANTYLHRARKAEVALAAEIAVAQTEREYASKMVALRFALEAQLARLDPENPLLKDEALIERIRRAGVEAVARTNDYGSAREAGLNYPIPARTPVGLRFAARPKTAAESAVELGALKLKIDQISTQHAVAMGQRAALMRQLRQVDPENPLLVDSALEGRLRKEVEAAYVREGKSVNAARGAGVSFPVPGREPPPAPAPGEVASGR